MFAQRSGLAGAFSKDKMFWEEYEKADLKVTAGQRGPRERAWLSQLFASLLISPLAEMNRRGKTEMQQSHSEKGLVLTKMNEMMKGEKSSGEISNVFLYCSIHSHLYSGLRHILTIWSEPQTLLQSYRQTSNACVLTYNLPTPIWKEKLTILL